MSGFNQINSISKIAMEVQLNVNCIYKFITFLVAYILVLFLFENLFYIFNINSTCSCNNNNLKPCIYCLLLSQASVTFGNIKMKHWRYNSF